jgi:hypothetical protein
MPSKIDGMAGFYMALILRCRWRIAGGGVVGGVVSFAFAGGGGVGGGGSRGVIGRHTVCEGEIFAISPQTGRVFHLLRSTR